MLVFYNLVQWILLLCVIISIFGVISRRFLMEKIFYLIAVFITLSLWLMLYGFEFLPLVILLLYVGAIAVLFLFVVMIVNPDYSEILEEKRLLYNTWKQQNQFNIKVNVVPVYSAFFNVILSIKGVIYFLLGILFVLLSSYFYDFHTLMWINTKVDSFILPIKHNNNVLDVLYLAELMYQDYGLSLLVVGLMLLVAIIGAILLTLKKSTNLKRQNISVQFFRYR
jgi:NADH-quinone oxidoreductase subunit J